MLVLTRRRDETVDVLTEQGLLLGSVTVKYLDSNKVRLGFDFPRGMRVDRREVTEARAAENQKH